MSPSPSRSQRLVDAVLGVRRRRRRAAYLAIVGGLRLLRPMLWRVAVASTAAVLAMRVL